jgi:peroxiredoxin
MSNLIEKLLETNDERRANILGRGGRKKTPPPQAPKPRRTPPRSWGISCLVLIVIIMVIAGGLLFYGFQPMSSNPAAQGATPGVVATTLPDARIVTYDGQSFALSDFRGSIVVLNFWSAGCAACAAESFSLQAIHDGYSAQGVVVVGINPVDSSEDAQAFMRQYQLTYRHAPDPNKLLSSQYNVQTIPQTFIIKRDGTLAQALTVAVDYQRLKNILDALLSSG